MKLIIWLLFISMNVIAEAPATPLDTAQVEEAPKEKLNGVFLYTHIDLLNFKWKDLSVEGEDLFVSPLNQNWAEWFKQNQQSLKSVEPCNNICDQEFNSWLEGKNLETRAGIWVKTNINLRILEDGRFETSGGVVFLDIETRKTLGAKIIENQKISLPLGDTKKRNSFLASSIYQSLLPIYSVLVSSIKIDQSFRSVKLLIKGFSSLGDIRALEKLIQEKKPDLECRTSIVSFARQEAQLSVTFRGEEKLFTDLLSELKELKSTQRFSLVHEFTENLHVLKMTIE